MNRERYEQEAKGRILEALDACDRHLKSADDARSEGDEDAVSVYLTLRDIAFRSSKTDEAFLQQIDIDRQIEELNQKLEELWTARRDVVAMGEATYQANVSALRSLGSDIEG